MASILRRMAIIGVSQQLGDVGGHLWHHLGVGVKHTKAKIERGGQMGIEGGSVGQWIASRSFLGTRFILKVFLVFVDY